MYSFLKNFHFLLTFSKMLKILTSIPKFDHKRALQKLHNWIVRQRKYTYGQKKKKKRKRKERRYNDLKRERFLWHQKGRGIKKISLPIYRTHILFLLHILSFRYRDLFTILFLGAKCKDLFSIHPSWSRNLNLRMKWLTLHWTLFLSL